MVSARPLDVIRINQSNDRRPIQLVFRNTFDQTTVSRPIWKVITVLIPTRHSLSTVLSPLPIAVSRLPPISRIPVTTRPPNTPHHREVPFEQQESLIAMEQLFTTEASPLNETISEIVDLENNPTTAPLLIHHSDD